DRTLGVPAERGQAVPGGVLRGGPDGQADTAARGLLVAEHVDDPVDEQSRVGPREDLVLGLLDPRAPVDVGVVARDRGVLVRLGVDALVLVLVVGGPALGDRPAVDQDRAALAGEVRVAHALVVGAGAEVVGLPELQVGRVQQQREEELHARDGDAPDRLVHRILTTWVASSSASGAVKSASGRRAWSEMRRRSATITQFATSEDPP